MRKQKEISRQEFLTRVGQGASFLLLGGILGSLGARNVRGGTVWQIDPMKCTQCGRCATECVLDQSAVRCFHEFRMCGYCNFCTGFFETERVALDEGAENQICPAGAIKRKFVTDPYFQYEIDELRCVGCARCVKGCTQFGNGSLYLQVRHDVCVHCNECSIVKSCPGNAFVRVPASKPYLPRLGGES